MSKKNNKTAFILIALVLLLAAAGSAAYFGGYLGGTTSQALPEQLTDLADGPVGDEAALDALDATPEETDAATSDTPAATDTATTPFVMDIDKAMAPRGIGNPDAPIKIIEFASLTCSHCAHFHLDVLADVKAKFLDTGRAYLEFQEFPLNAPALDASLLARCLPAERYETFVGLLFKTQEDWIERPDYINVLKQNAKLAGLSDEGVDTCLKSTPLRQAIGQRIQKASEQWKISSTPTFVFNDGADFIRGAMPVDEFERIIVKLEGGSAAPADTAPATDEVPAPDVVTPDAMPAPDVVAPAEPAVETPSAEETPVDETPAE